MSRLIPFRSRIPYSDVSAKPIKLHNYQFARNKILCVSTALGFWARDGVMLPLFSHSHPIMLRGARRSPPPAFLAVWTRCENTQVYSGTYSPSCLETTRGASSSYGRTTAFPQSHLILQVANKIHSFICIAEFIFVP
jgi:hypothetical protein